MGILTNPEKYYKRRKQVTKEKKKFYVWLINACCKHQNKKVTHKKNSKK